ncbi:MAG: hypothetical protein ACKVS6_01230 [Planctomycetota bacterium]
MISLLRGVTAAFLLFPLAAVPAPPCVPKGGSVDVGPFTPNDDYDGAPTSLQPVGNATPQAFEDDHLRDDEMGAATPQAGGGTTVQVSCSADGKLSGPNGEVQNGGAEGDCIEVIVKWKYKYKIVDITAVQGSALLEILGLSFTSSIHVEKWRKITISSKEKIEVCPCP